MNEQQFFEQHKAEWLKTHANQWVWIHGCEAEFFPTYDAAVEHAYSKGFDKQPIFIQQIIEKETPTSVAGYYKFAV